jgi:hypothetical protein
MAALAMLFALKAYRHHRMHSLDGPQDRDFK